MNTNTKLFVSARAVAAAFAVNVHAAGVVTSSDPNTIDKWYGRAGGLTDAERITGVTVGTSRVGVAYDADVAARTNMQRGQAANGKVGVSYDADVAARTNMPRGGDAAGPSTAAIVIGTKSN
jgi:hypothetical protein